MWSSETRGESAGFRARLRMSLPLGPARCAPTALALKQTAEAHGKMPALGMSPTRLRYSATPVLSSCRSSLPQHAAATSVLSSRVGSTLDLFLSAKRVHLSAAMQALAHLEMLISSFGHFRPRPNSSCLKHGPSKLSVGTPLENLMQLLSGRRCDKQLDARRSRRCLQLSVCIKTGFKRLKS